MLFQCTQDCDHVVLNFSLLFAHSHRVSNKGRSLTAEHHELLPSSFVGRPLADDHHRLPQTEPTCEKAGSGREIWQRE